MRKFRTPWLETVRGLPTTNTKQEVYHDVD